LLHFVVRRLTPALSQAATIDKGRTTFVAKK
jgi:hypothetical protein